MCVCVCAHTSKSATQNLGKAHFRPILHSFLPSNKTFVMSRIDFPGKLNADFAKT